MRSSRWQAQGNVYLVAEEPLTAELVRAEVGDADGILEVRERGDDWVRDRDLEPGRLPRRDVRERHPHRGALARRADGRRTRSRCGSGPARSRLGCSATASSSRSSVRSSVGEAEEVEGIRFTPVDVGNPHAVVDGDPAELDRIGPLLETHPRFPNRTNVQVARRLDQHTIEARVWERGVGETGASGTSAIAVVAALGGGRRHGAFPGRRSPRPGRGRRGPT